MTVEPETLFLTHYRTPLGTYIIISSKQGVVCIEPEEEAKNRIVRWQNNGIQLKKEGNEYNSMVVSELDGYFEGRLSCFELPLDLRGTPFQCQVWQLLQGIAYGETVSYGDLAHRLGQDSAARAVGGAVGSNPVSIVVPCHRVIGSNGNLTGYGGGLARKRALLDLEAKFKGKMS